jgi:hypothetical protein
MKKQLSKGISKSFADEKKASEAAKSRDASEKQKSRKNSEERSRTKSNSYRPEATGLDLHKDAAEDMKERGEMTKKRTKMTVKRVSVAANQKFEEASDDDSYSNRKKRSVPGMQPLGEVRKFVRDMK